MAEPEYLDLRTAPPSLLALCALQVGSARPDARERSDLRTLGSEYFQVTVVAVVDEENLNISPITLSCTAPQDCSGL